MTRYRFRALACCIVAVLLGGCWLKTPEEWIGLPFVPGAYDVRCEGGSVVYLAPVTSYDAILWYRERFAEEGWSVPSMPRRLSRPDLIRILSVRGMDYMSVWFLPTDKYVEGVTEIRVYVGGVSALGMR